ncbi:erythromycin esterase family protein [Candidatus Nitrosocosmicus sp. T]
MSIQFSYDSLEKPKDIDFLLSRIGEAEYVLLGEASHGTSEFYQWRSEISKRLIKEKGFLFIAVEGDWPDCYKVNKYVKGMSDAYKTAKELLRSFNRWPTWMWANTEMVELVEWLKGHNKGIHNEDQKAGFYGLDLYSLWESMEEIIQYLKRVDPLLLQDAIKAYNCFEPYNKEVEAYARATAFVPKNCEKEVIDMLVALRNKQTLYSKNHENRDDYFNAEQNALTVKDAENYYRTMIRGDVNSWNLRDTHMMDTLERLVNYQANGSSKKKPKAIVWAHNTHIGDARFTDMSPSGMINIGQLVREKKGIQNTVLIGFSTYEGTVIAAREWGARMEIMNVPQAREGSWDCVLHNLSVELNSKKRDRTIVFDRNSYINSVLKKTDDNLIYDENYETRGQRAIGVVYNPQYERYGNYVPTILSLRYDALLFIDNTNALYPLHLKQVEDKDLPDTFPRGE